MMESKSCLISTAHFQMTKLKHRIIIHKDLFVLYQVISLQEFMRATNTTLLNIRLMPQITITRCSA